LDTTAYSTLSRGAFVLSAPPTTYTTLVGLVPGMVAAATAWPLRPTGRGVVLVQLTLDGLNATFATRVNVTGVLAPPEVWMTTGPVAAPAGTVVTMSVVVQSPGLAIVAVTVPPDPFENSTCPAAAAWLAPKFEP